MLITPVNWSNAKLRYKYQFINYRNIKTIHYGYNYF